VWWGWVGRFLGKAAITPRRLRRANTAGASSSRNGPKAKNPQGNNRDHAFRAADTLYAQKIRANERPGPGFRAFTKGSPAFT